MSKKQLSTPNVAGSTEKKTQVKRNAKGSGSVRRLANGTYEGRYTYGRDPGTGKQLQDEIYGKTEKEVRKELRKILVSIDEGTYVPRSKMTVGEWLDIWHKDYLGSVKPHTISQYGTQIKIHLKPKLGAVKLIELSPHLIQGMYNALKRGEDRAAPLSAKSIRNLHGVLHKALHQAVRLNYIRTNPTDACILPRVEKTQIKPIEDTKIKELLVAMQGHKFEALYLIDLFTGLRLGEIIALTWDCVDFKKDILTVNKQLQRERVKGGAYRFVSLKNDKSRTISPAKAVINALTKQNQRQKEWKLKAGEQWNNSMNLVFTNEFGGHLAAHTVYTNFKRLAASIGIPEARVHDLRHTFAMLSLQNGDDVKTVQENLGHATASFTLDKYGHVSERMRKESADRMDAYIQDISKK